MSWQSYPDENNIDEMKRTVERYFRVYETAQEGAGMAFFVEVPPDEEMLAQKFEFLRKELKQRNFIPFLREKNGEYLIFITYRPPVKGKPRWVNLALLVTTVVTTTLSGAILFVEGETVSAGYLFTHMFDGENLLRGFVFFSLPLMAILGIHELGHYVVSKRHGVAASLPFFIPLPPNPFLPLGTMGALISMREPIPDRRSLLDIGIAGPIAGFLIAIPVLLVGLSMSSTVSLQDIPEGTVMLGDNLLIILFSHVMFSVPAGYTISLHPTAFAGWVGLLVTAINLLPAGQLDGGHVARAVLKEKHRYASLATIVFLASLTFLGFGNWLFLLLLLVFLIGTQHPPPLNEYMPLDTRRKLLAMVALIIFILSFTPSPVS